MEIIERESGLEGRVLRPLSAKHFPPTEPELQGLVDREKLLAIAGRSRREQMDLAEEMGINDYPCPAGGCLLTDPGFAGAAAQPPRREPGPEHEPGHPAQGGPSLREQRRSAHPGPPGRPRESPALEPAPARERRARGRRRGRASGRGHDARGTPPRPPFGRPRPWWPATARRAGRTTLEVTVTSSDGSWTRSPHSSHRPGRRAGRASHPALAPPPAPRARPRSTARPSAAAAYAANDQGHAEGQVQARARRTRSLVRGTAGPFMPPRAFALAAAAPYGPHSPSGFQSDAQRGEQEEG